MAYIIFLGSNWCGFNFNLKYIRVAFDPLTNSPKWSFLKTKCLRVEDATIMHLRECEPESQYDAVRAASTTARLLQIPRSRQPLKVAYTNSKVWINACLSFLIGTLFIYLWEYVKGKGNKVVVEKGMHSMETWSRIILFIYGVSRIQFHLAH